MRCKECAKFVGVDQGDPEEDLEVETVDGSAHVSGSVRISLNCAECSGELKEASLDVDLTVDLEHLEGCDKDSELELDVQVENFDEFIPPKAKRQKHMYGATLAGSVKCPCGAQGEVTWKDSVQSSAMDDC